MKRITALLLTLVLALGLAACGAAQPEPETVATVTQQPSQQFTGVLEDKKDFMIVVVGDDGNAYTFNLEGVTVPAEPSQRVTVTYTGDITDFDSQLTATKVELAQN